MKKLLFYLMLLMGLNSYSQVHISIPDLAFENYLETHNAAGVLVPLGSSTSMGDGNPINHSVPLAKIVGVTSLTVGDSNIDDLTGIRSFAALNYLWCDSISNLITLDLTGLSNLNTLVCSDNNMTSLVLTGCVNLTYVSCYDNNLGNLDFSGFPNLQYLNCSRSGLTSLNVVGLSNLFEFYCFENQLTTLNLTGLTDLSKFNCSTNLLTCLDLTNKRDLILMSCIENPNLTCVQVDDVGFASSNSNFIEEAFTTYNLSCPGCPTTNPCTTLITPTFTPYDQYCSGDTTVPPLPTTSNNQNGITGTWSPAYNNLVTTTYTFTPDAGQCATTTTLTINFVPSFTNTSTLTACNSYTWAANGTTYTSSGTYTYVDGCDTEILELTIVPTITSQFINVSTGIDNSGNALATGSVDPNWQITSSPNPPGTPALVSNYWSPYWEVTPVSSTNAGWINHYGAPIFLPSQIGIYTFERPFTVGAGTTSIDYNLTVAYDDILQSFEFVRPDNTTSPINVTIGSNGARFLSVSTPNSVLPSTQAGIWKIRAVVNFFDYGAGFLLSGTITVNTNTSTVPTFNQIAPICSGTTLSPLPISSTNSTPITGTWSPALDNLVTTTYTFTPDAGQCATTATMTIVVNPNITPTFNTIAPVCSGTTLSPLPTSSTNSTPITGTWSPAFNGYATTTYTFTPDPGQCATTTTLEVVVNTVHDISFLDIIVTMTGTCSAFNGLYNWDGFLNGKSSFALSTDPTFKISFDGTKWVLWSQDITNDTGFQNTNVPANNLPPTTGWTATQCVGGTLDLSFPYYNVTSFCAGATVGSITPTLSNLNYYTSEVGGTALATSTPLVSGIYYVSQTLNGCESYRAAVLDININPIVTPTFNIIAPVCAGSVDTPLQNTSIDGITGNWSPSFNPNATTIYTFTPNAGQCASNTTTTITILPVTSWYYDGDGDGFGSSIDFVTLDCIQPLGWVANNLDCNDNNPLINPNSTITPTFSQIAPVCSTTNVSPLPTISNNGITGTWTPAFDNTAAATTYTFTPDAGQCATTTTMTINIITATRWYQDLDADGYGNPNVRTVSCTQPVGYVTDKTDCNDTNPLVPASNIPTFTQVAPICLGDNLAALPLNSTNTTSISGTWSPTLDNTTTTTYTFTPNAGQCATTATMTIEVNPQTVPTFSQIGPFCQNSTAPTLSPTSNEGISGTWSPSIIDTSQVGTYIYMFTPNAGLCAMQTAISITINPVIVPYFTAWNPLIINSVAPSLPTASSTGITGTWFPTIVDTSVLGSYTYTFTPDTTIAGQECAIETSFVVEVVNCSTYITAIRSTYGTVTPTRYLYVEGITLPNGLTITNYEYEVTNLTTNQVGTFQTTDNNFRLMDVTPSVVAYNTNFEVRVRLQINGVWQSFCNVRTVNTNVLPSVSVRNTYCGLTLPTINELIFCTYNVLAASYVFEITNNTTQAMTTSPSNTNSFRLTNAASDLFPIKFNQQYSVRVKYTTLVDGVIIESDYSAPCIVTTPAGGPVPVISSPACGSTVAFSGSLVKCTNVANASEYKFVLINGTSTLLVQNRTVNNFTFSIVSGYVPATLYSVTPWVKLYGVWYEGTPCNLTSPGAPLLPAKLAQDTKQKGSSGFAVKTYPNPYTENFKLNVTSSIEGALQVKVYDMLGKLVENKETNISDIETLEVGSNYPSGVYNVVVSQGENVQSLRIIKR